ncbi:NACHT, LRR and PYD domains-containing protein 1b allele 3-like [Sebastes fasciatus]|uniref:NACHT, LRR and PYD domains-containing protein 1b allele 3-like n=1 Tax=Sebastes fasciatus TaxID=394691 RepID=UPI003D9DB7B1
MRKKHSSAAAGPSSFQLSTSSSEEDVYDFNDELSGCACSESSASSDQDSTVCSEGSRTQDVYELSEQSEPGGDSGALPDMDVPVTAANCSVTNTLPARSHLQIFSSDPRWSRRDSSGLPRSYSMPSLSQITSPNICRGAGSLPNMLLNTSFEEFTPDITADEHDETYRFQCSGPGLYQCSVTGLVFHMEGEGVLVYRTVPWSRRLLVQHHKRPAGPLFDIKCVQQSVCRLHLPHCEIRSTGGGHFLSVAHLTDEDVEFISPHEITETHVIINITGFSGFGNVKDEDSPADPVRALVLLFYKPPADPVLTSLLNVLLLPRNVVLRDVLRIRKKLVGDERYIETSPHCKLHPKQEYSLSTRPEDDSVLVQPKEAEFDCDNYDNYFPSFQVRLKTILTDIKLFLRDTNSSYVVWEREVCLSSTGGRRSALNLPLPEGLMDIRSSFVDSISGPVLKSLLDKLLEKKVIGDSEWGSADVIQNNSDKARFVIDTVRKKGEAASSEMIEFLCEADPFLCEHLGLT